MVRHDMITFILRVSKDFLERLLTFLIDAGLWVEDLIMRIDMKLVDKQPTVLQYANRLIEFVDMRFIAQAYNRYEALVRSGVSPDHAFRMVVEQ